MRAENKHQLHQPFISNACSETKYNEKIKAKNDAKKAVITRILFEKFGTRKYIRCTTKMKP